MKTPTLKELLVQELNPAFVRDLLAGAEALYPAAHSSMTQDENLGEVQAKWILGYYRRARAETLLQQTAIKHGLKQRDVQPEGGGPSHVSIYPGHFELVMCHVPSSDAFPQYSMDREQSSQVNEFIAQMDMLAEPDNLSTTEFFGVFIHTEQLGRKDTFGSLKIGFPNAEFNDWVEAPICVREIADLQAKRFQKTSDLQAQVQDASVQWKTKPQEKKYEVN